MHIKELLTERIHTNILCVDIQPEYDEWADEIVGPAAEFLNKQEGKIIILYNGEGQTADRADDVLEYLYKYGFDPEKGNYQMVSKQYGFFRSWMDLNVPVRIILKVIRGMIMQRVTDSRDVDLTKILTIPQIDILESHAKYDSIYLPDFMTVAQLRNLSPFYLIGGGRYQCVQEVELICNAFNIRYKRIDSLIYG